MRRSDRFRFLRRYNWTFEISDKKSLYLRLQRILLSLVPMLSINAGEESRAWYQTYAHALDIAVFITSMTYDVFTEDD